MKLKGYALFTAGAVFLLVLGGCAHRPQEAMKSARKALDEAEQSGAPEKHPSLYQQAQEHFEEGNRQLSYFRYNLARCEFDAAAKNASLAAAYSREAPVFEEPSPACPPCPPPVGDCCAELSWCQDRNRELKKELAEGGVRVVYKTRVVREPCPEDEFKEPPPSDCAFLGALMVQPPPGITPDRSEYEIKVKFIAAKFGDRGRADDYRLLIDVIEVEPSSVEVVSHMIDYEPIGVGEWSLPVLVPPGLDRPVLVTLGVTLWNARTNQEQNLPAYQLAIPSLRPAAKEAKPEKPPVARPDREEGGTSPLLLVAAAVAGLVLGLVAALLLFRGRSRSSLG